MPRRPRSDLAGFPLHLIQRGNNRAACFFSDADRTAYLHWLGSHAARLDIKVHAWVLMTNHVHLLITVPSPAHASRLMQALGRSYVRYVNRAYARSGTLWEGRFHACAVHAEGYLLACMRYIELNPVRAGLTSDPGAYPWSSNRRNALGQSDALLSEHPLYTGLGATSADRQVAYRDLFHGHFDEAALIDIRGATTAGHLLAGEPFRRQIERVLGRRLGPAPRGRPRKAGGEEADGEQLALKL
ncbi:MAG: transposase [Betaproteobacteria bacterium]|nr:transposase [Betaproteobacteria bacterium]